MRPLQHPTRQQPPKSSPMILTFWYSRHYVILSPFTSNKNRMHGTMMGCPFWNGYKGLCLSSCSPSLTLLCSEGSQLPCCELSYGEIQKIRNWGKPPARNWRHQSSSPWGNEAYQQSREWAWVCQLPQLSFRYDSSLGWRPESCLVRPWARGTQISWAWTPDLHKLWDSKCLLEAKFWRNLWYGSRFCEQPPGWSPLVHSLPLPISRFTEAKVLF